MSGIDTLGIYIEGFKDLDGLEFAKAVRKAVLNGKQIVVYKSGKTDPGAKGVMGHTASIAGAAMMFDSVLRQAGAIVAEDFNSFDDLLYIAGALHHKKVKGKRLGGISGAGFEAVGIADSIQSDNFVMKMGALEPATVAKLEEILTAKKLNMLVEVRNPIDINPGADDEAHLQIVEAFLQDPNIDAVVVGMDPTAPAIRSLASSTLRPGFDITDPKSSVHLMPQLVNRNDKPVVGIVDGGALYDAMAAKLMDQGVCVFRNCARGTKALVRYFEARLNAESLIKRNR
jgi:acyl-CoA synthetase (NDP forming)